MDAPYVLSLCFMFYLHPIRESENISHNCQELKQLNMFFSWKLTQQSQLKFQNIHFKQIIQRFLMFPYSKFKNFQRQIQVICIYTIIFNMINLAYVIFLYILIAEVILFLLLTLPTPAGFKSKLVRAFMGSKLKSSLMWVHLALCILAGLFFLDLAQTQVNYVQEKDRLRQLGNGHVGTEVRMGFLSYQIQRVERNKYITAMLIYASVALNLYVRILYLIYKKRGDYDGLPPLSEQKQAVSPARQSQKASTVARESAKSEQTDRSSLTKKVK